MYIKETVRFLMQPNKYFLNAHFLADTMIGANFMLQLTENLYLQPYKVADSYLKP
jgi:hypothetical protein